MVSEKRWQQRFDSFNKALSQLELAVNQKNYSKLEMAGLIKTFEFTFELGWKTLKDLLEKEGYEAKTPRQTIKQAFQASLIEDGKLWLEVLDNRNIMSHTYDEDDTLTAVSLIKDHYFSMLLSLHNKLTEELTKCSD